MWLAALWFLYRGIWGHICFVLVLCKLCGLYTILSRVTSVLNQLVIYMGPYTINVYLSPTQKCGVVLINLLFYIQNTCTCCLCSQVGSGSL